MKFLIFVVALIVMFSVFFFAMKTSKPTIVVMLGPPGAGKGTQSVMLTNKLGIPQISTGDLFRDHLKRKSELGKRAKEYMNSGQLVPDELVLDMFFERISQPDCKSGFILDGFPRTVAQAEAMDRQLKSAHIKVVSLELSDQTIVKRLTNRVVCSNCGAPYHLEAFPPKEKGICDKCGSRVVQRSDDKEDVVRKRLEVFHEQTEPVKYHYEKKGFLTLIEAAGDKNKTYSDILSALKRK